MSNIKTNHQISTSVIDIIKNSKEFCFIVSPYFQPWKQLLKALELASSEEKKIFFLFRDDQSRNEDILMLNADFNFDIFFINNLHAKIYLNESEAMITSMNLYDYSKENNFEIAYSMNSKSDVNNIAKDIIVGEMLKIWRTDTLFGRYADYINEQMFDPHHKVISTQANNSFCVRCKKRIPYNFDKPFCYSCSIEWNIFRNAEYLEHYCHKCGIDSQTTKSRPLCFNCFKNSTNVYKF